jgi:hypothetical protein
VSPSRPKNIRASPKVIADNEAAAKAAFRNGDYVLCFLLEHALVEALLRTYLDDWRDERRFADLVAEYCRMEIAEGQARAEFREDLEGFNRRRNRVVHRLSRVGYGRTNQSQNLKDACVAGMLLYTLFIEWLETFDPDIVSAGFKYDK